MPGYLCDERLLVHVTIERRREKRYHNTQSGGGGLDARCQDEQTLRTMEEEERPYSKARHRQYNFKTASVGAGGAPVGIIVRGGTRKTL